MAAAGDWSTVAQFEASLVQPEAPVLEAEDILSIIPEGRESAETTMNQDDAADPPPADAGAAAAEAARLDAIEQRQDEAEEILVYLETAILPFVESVTTAAWRMSCGWTRPSSGWGSATGSFGGETEPTMQLSWVHGLKKP